MRCIRWYLPIQQGPDCAIPIRFEEFMTHLWMGCSQVHDLLKFTLDGVYIGQNCNKVIVRLVVSSPLDKWM